MDGSIEDRQCRLNQGVLHQGVDLEVEGFESFRMRMLSPWYPSDGLLRKSLKGGLVTVARLKEKTHLIGWVARERKRLNRFTGRVEQKIASGFQKEFYGALTLILRERALSGIPSSGRTVLSPWFRDLLRIENETIKRNRLDKGRILMSFPLSNIILNKINLMIKWEAFDVMLEKDKQLIISSWFDELLGLRSKPWNSNLNSPSKWEGFLQGSGNMEEDVLSDCEAPCRRVFGSKQARSQADGPVQSFPEVIGNRSAEKGKGIWIKKAKVKKRIIYNKTVKVNLDRKKGDGVRKVDSKSCTSTSSDFRGFLWNGESSRGRLYVGPQSPSLDLIIKAHPRPSPEGFVAKGGKVQFEDFCGPGGSENLHKALSLIGGSDFDGSELGKIRSEDFCHVLKSGNGLNGGLISNLGDNESAELGEISLSMVLPTPHLKRNCKLKRVLAKSHGMKTKGDKRS
ncbi:hypothetical protein LWI28_026361 [Acer negundo]|uniref:Uncharacterized protein n=1 Tax=Acer negundo TaxID=4023 RepID=A0AAD5JV61_ACENE|nr:hypothetical protein LWI28_026361 [Acer negundo]